MWREEASLLLFALFDRRRLLVPLFRTLLIAYELIIGWHGVIMVLRSRADLTD